MSNLIGKIQGTVKEGKSCIKLNSDIVDINGLEITSDGIFGGFTKGMIVQVQHKDYKKSVAKNTSGWVAIDNNLETGFVVAIKPSSSASNVLVSCNLHIGINQSIDGRWWGARLYRKIGNGDWIHVSEADNNESNGETGTTVWLSDNMGIAGNNQGGDDYLLSNLGNSFLDYPNTTEMVYYTIYWKCRLGENSNNGNGNDPIYLNRSYQDNLNYTALPISNITAKEIWNSGTVYRPDNNLITLDQSDNNVDISGTLNVQGEKVMTVPALDICGNDLSANTTYEITTGPPGSINNISFVKKQQAFINWEMTDPSTRDFHINQIIDGGNGSDIIGAGHVTSGKNLISTSTITRGGQQVVQASNIDINTPANGRIRVTLSGVYLISAHVSAFLNVDERAMALRLFINNTLYGGRVLSQVIGDHNDQGPANQNGGGMVSISAVAMLEAFDFIHFTIESDHNNDVGIDTIQGQIVKIN